MGSDIEAKDNDGWTPLHRAARRGRVEVVHLLISKGADIKAKNIYGDTPLHQAVFSGDREVVELLLAKGAERGTKIRMVKQLLILLRVKKLNFC